MGPVVIMVIYLLIARKLGKPSTPSKNSSSSTPQAPLVFKVAAYALDIFALPYFLLSFSIPSPDETTSSFPLPGITFKWFGVALQPPDLWRAMTLSLQVDSSPPSPR